MTNEFINRHEIVTSQDHSKITKLPPQFQHQIAKELISCDATNNQDDAEQSKTTMESIKRGTIAVPQDP